MTVLPFTMLTEGQLIDDKYRLLGEIARGDLGPVYQATEVQSGHVYTLRLITRVASPDGSLVGRLRQESEQVEKLRHPNIMPFGEVGEVEGRVYAARRFVEGVTLQDLIVRETPLLLPRACSIARQIASALETAHNAGVLHGNLNPSNVLVNEQHGLAAVKVLGLGSFGLKEHSFIDMARLVLSGSECPIGSPEYISPEQAVGTEADTLDGRSDLYSLGVILYHMLAGEPPFRSNNAMQVLLGHVFDDAPPLRDRPGIEVPEVIETLIMRSLAKKREHRPASATAWVDQLGPWEKSAATSDSSSEPAQSPTPFTSWQRGFAASGNLTGNGDAEPGAVEKPAFATDFTPASPISLAEIRPPIAPTAPYPSALQPTLSQTPSFVTDFGTQGPGRAIPARPPEAASAAPQVGDSEIKPAAPIGPEPFIIAGIEPEGEASAPGLAGTSGQGIDIDLQEPPAVEPIWGPAPLNNHVSARSGVLVAQHQQPQAAAGSWRKWLTAIVVVLVGIGLAGAWLYYTGRRYWLRPQYVLGRVSSLVSRGSASTGTTTPAPAAASTAPSATSPPPGIPPPVTTGAASAGSSLEPLAQTAPQPAGDQNKGATSKAAVSSPPDAAAENPDAVRDAIRRGNYYFLLGQYNDAIKAYTVGLTISPGNPELLAEIARAKKAQAAEAEFLGH